MKLLVGIDVSSKTLEVVMMTSEALKPVFQGTFENDLNGATELKTIILTLNEQRHFDQITIGMESTSIYSFHPAYFFMNDDDLAQFNIESVVLNPRDTKRYKDVFEDNKNDQIDALYIADYLRNGRFTTSLVREDEYIALQRLTRSRFELVSSLARSKQHFLENLYYKVNKLAVNTDGEKVAVFGNAIFNLLTEEMKTDELINASTEDLIDYLNAAGRGRFADAEKTAKAIQKAVRGSYRLPKVIQNSIDINVSIYAAEIRTYQKLIKELDKQIEAIVTVLPETEILQSIPGIGPFYSAGILAEIGQIERFDKETQLARYAGLAWKQNQSGDFNGQITPRTHTGNKYLRYYLIEAAGSVTRYDSVFRAYYEKKMSEVTKTPRKRGLALTARKLVRVLDVLLRRHQLYQKEESV